MELSLLCDIKVFLFLYDYNENKLIQYQSDENDQFVTFNAGLCNQIRTQHQLYQEMNERQTYTDPHYDDFYVK